MQRYFRMLQNHQQFSLVGVQSPQQIIKGCKTGSVAEYLVEAVLQDRLALWTWVETVGFEAFIVEPDQPAGALLNGIVLICEGVELMHQPFGVNPTQRMIADFELFGIITDDHRIGEQAMCADTAP